MNTVTLILLAILIILIWGYIGYTFWMNKKIQAIEKNIIRVFLYKVSKIPAMIEVMRPYVVDPRAFDTITTIHSEAMTRAYDGIYHLLEDNARIQREFLFLMKLSAQIPRLQKKEYFLYIRDFIIGYERDMRVWFPEFNEYIRRWNILMQIKKYSLIGSIFPGHAGMEVK
jgi:hypothetical protein